MSRQNIPSVDNSSNWHGVKSPDETDASKKYGKEDVGLRINSERLPSGSRAK